MNRIWLTQGIIPESVRILQPKEAEQMDKLFQGICDAIKNPEISLLTCGCTSKGEENE